MNRLLLDLDGVCNQMIMYAMEFVGCPVSRYRDDDYPIKGNYDLVANVNSLLGTATTPEEFWKEIPREVWSDSPPSPEFPWLLENCERLVGRKNVCLLTAPTKDPESLAGKLEWIHRFAPKYLHRQYLVGPAKHFCAAGGCLLVDDSDANVNLFREQGGEAILVPRPWNSLHKKNTLEHLKQQFALYQSIPTALQTRFQHLKLLPGAA